MPHRIRAHGEWWIIEREYDPGYLGNGSRLDHQGTGEAVIDVAREVMADPDRRAEPDDGLEVWGASVTYNGYCYGVTNEAAWEREQDRRKALGGERAEGTR